MTPLKALYGCNPPALLRFTEDQSAINEVNKQIQERNQILDDLKENLAKTQSRMKKFADMGRRELHWEIGERVFLKLHPYWLRSLAKRFNEKLSLQFYGPFEIKGKVKNAAYKLDLRPYARIHLVFHVSQLKRVIGPTINIQPLPSYLMEDMELKL